jgi:hypothetical protein
MITTGHLRTNSSALGNGMSSSGSGSRPPTYDRRLLLGDAKRNTVLELWEVQQYGRDSYGDADYVSIYGMSPSLWYAKGVRLLGRTAVECTRDQLAEAIARDVADLVGTSSAMRGAFVVDLFAGSANTLYWILHHLPHTEGLGFELDPMIWDVTRRNLATLSMPINIANTDYASGLADLALGREQLLIAFIAPPWGDALSHDLGLNLRRTAPPVMRVLGDLVDRFPTNRLLCAVQVYELVDPTSLAELRQCFDWSTLHVYSLNAAGANHGTLFGTRGWVP